MIVNISLYARTIRRLITQNRCEILIDISLRSRGNDLMTYENTMINIIMLFTTIITRSDLAHAISHVQASQIKFFFLC